MEKYKVRSLNGESSEISDKKEAFKVYKQWKESDMEEGVERGG